MKFTKKNIIITAIIIFILLLPALLVLNPVLEKFQERNTKWHKKLVQKRDKGEDVSQEWEDLKYRQKLLATIYHYTFREYRTAKAYEKYLEWFQSDWQTKEFAEIKYTTATIYRSISHGSSQRREFLRKAACHFQEVLNMYEHSGPDFEEYRRKSRRAISSFNLYKYMGECE